MHLKKIIQKKLIIVALSIIASFLFGYFFGYLHHLYLTREPIEFIGEINPGGCQNP
jgi:hypothetical protein